MKRAVVVGSGAREHALAWRLAASAQVVVTPGNAGIAAHGITCVPTPATELDADLFVIGPEAPLVEGLADRLRAQGKVVVGPGADGARLEGSKAFMKEFLTAASVPTAAYGAFTEVEPALAFLATMAPPYVVKTDGLAAGKGVLVTDDLGAAAADVRDKLSGAAFGDAGTTVVIEEGLLGVECSLLYLCDGTNATALAPAQDFKRVGDGDAGANTGGMGAYAPMDAARGPVEAAVRTTIVEPTLAELARRGIDFRGVLYAGVMLTESGPKLLEYNVRFGDPETEAIMAVVDGDLFECLGTIGRGAGAPDLASAGYAVTVVLASPGYPERPRTGGVIEGLGEDGQLASPLEGVVVFHAGTVRDDAGRFVTAGGRVLAVTAVASSIDAARALAYEGCARITFEGMVMRTDIAAAVGHP
ncbi:MAG: phosphoribosylamine--glycine ligase [Actinomycetales bacterium]|nr:phosphoribosylamine--glycine ligase [Actinomycetales bacterium]